MDKMQVLSNIWKDWCKVNNIPKHDNGQYYSADDIMINHYQDMPFEPSVESIKFMRAFAVVWEVASDD